MTRRILHILPSLAHNGTARLALGVATGLPRPEFESHVFAIEGGPCEAAFVQAGVPVVVCRRHRLFGADAVWRLRRLVSKLCPVIVHAWAPPAAQVALAAWARPLVVSYRLGHGRSPWWLLERLYAGRARRIVVGTAAEREILGRHGLPRQRIDVIPAGVELPRFGELQEATVGLRAELELPSDVRLIAAVGRLEARRRLKDLIWAADILKCVRQDFRLLIVGEGPQRHRLEQYRQAVEIDDLVYFLGPRGDVPRLLAQCDVYWAAAGGMSHSLALLEAMAAGLPAVAADSPGHRALVVPGETGYLVPIGQRPTYARHTLALLEQPELRARLGQAAHERAASQFPLAQTIARHAQLYREVLG